jgi:hypothetical protein
MDNAVTIADLIIEGGHRVVSVVGLAKNSGKTTTLNRIIKDMAFRPILLGLTSTGRDGEAVDSLLHIKKPRIEIGIGVVFTGVMGDLVWDIGREGAVEMIRTTDLTTAMGNIIVARAKRSAQVVLMGPATVSEMGRLVESLISIDGCTMVLVDGSMDRIAAAGSSVADGVVLAAGAVMGPDIKGVVEKTAHAVELLEIERAAVSSPEASVSDRIVAVSVEGVRWETRGGTLVSDGEWALKRLKKGAEYLFTSGAVTDEALEVLIQGGRFPELIVPDATRFLISRRQKERWKDGGGRLSVVNRLRLIAVTVNPENPEGKGFDGREFFQAMQERLPEVAVFDVMEHRNDT